MPEGLPILLLLAGIALAVFSISWTSTKSRTLIEQWAAENGYRLLASEYRTFRRGPYFWTSSKGQTVYYVTVELPDGTVRSGWIRCGSYWGGLWSSKGFGPPKWMSAGTTTEVPSGALASGTQPHIAESA